MLATNKKKIIICDKAKMTNGTLGKRKGTEKFNNKAISSSFKYSSDPEGKVALHGFLEHLIFSRFTNGDNTKDVKQRSIIFFIA
jgi:hypothetical protein